MSETHDLYPQPTKKLTDMRKGLAPSQIDAFRAFAQSVFADGALDARTKQLIAVAVAHVTHCPYCIRSHTRSAMQKGATPEQIMEAIWVASEMSAGAAYAHSLLALDEVSQTAGRAEGERS
jgi:AhpD family alkylhydroperoxidase